MGKKIVIAILSVGLVVVLLVGWRGWRGRHDDPARLAAIRVTLEDTRHWRTYRYEHFGLELKYPENYFLAKTSDFDAAKGFGYITLRQDARSAEDCKTLGKRIGAHVYRLGQVSGIGLGGRSVKLTPATTVADIEGQFLADDNRPQVRRNCHRREINGVDAIVCTSQAPGENAWLTGGIYDVFVLGVYERANGERLLVKISNNAGGTPHTGDRALRRDTVRVFHTLRWGAGETP